MIAVIADDITGAAEVAGIACRLGLRVCFVMATGDFARMAGDADVLVVATDTRSMSADDAAAESRRVGAAVAAMPGVEHIFKKTDSALRGHVVEELGALLDVTHYSRALYLPANPSKQRTISGGIYYICGIPIHLTDFARDPEFPAFSSALAERFPHCGGCGIGMADAADLAGIDRAVTSASPETMLAGAADLFTAFLHRHAPVTDKSPDKPLKVAGGDMIVVCGSTQSDATVSGAPVSLMPAGVYDGKEGIDAWAGDAAAKYADTGAVTLAMAHTHRTGHEAASYLRSVMAAMVERLVAVRSPRVLVIEGGATAYAVLSALGWRQFAIDGEFAPGVINMSSQQGTRVIMKPGSYPWGPLFA